MNYELNAGHGGSDSGAIGSRQVYESNVNLDVVKITGRILTEQGHNVTYTRLTDVFIDLNEISNIANRRKVDYFISFHEDSTDDVSVNGTSTFCLARGGKAEKLAIAIQNELLLALKLNDRGVKQANFAVLRQTNMPAVLIESSFISNLAQEIKLISMDYKETMGLAIAKGIIKGTGQAWKDTLKTTLPYIVTNYLPYGNDGTEINAIKTKYFNDIDRLYIKFNTKGIWIETQYLTAEKAQEIKARLGNLFYSIS